MHQLHHCHLNLGRSAITEHSRYPQLSPALDDAHTPSRRIVRVSWSAFSFPHSSGAYPRARIRRDGISFHLHCLSLSPAPQQSTSYIRTLQIRTHAPSQTPIPLLRSKSAVQALAATPSLRLDPPAKGGGGGEGKGLDVETRKILHANNRTKLKKGMHLRSRTGTDQLLRRCVRACVRLCAVHCSL